MAILDEMRVLERLQFFDGQRLFASDLQGLEAFNREMRWLHNSSLHQIGIANGFAVRGSKGDRVVRVESGLALDVQGREIVLIEDEELSVPPVAADSGGQPVVYDLVVSYPEDLNLEQVETRAGVCVPRGVVRLQEQPVFCWVRLKRNLNGDLGSEDPVLGREIEQGIRIVIARAEVINCQLHRDLSLAERRSARPEQSTHFGSGVHSPDLWELFWWSDRDRVLEAVFTMVRGWSTNGNLAFTGHQPWGAFTTAIFSLGTASPRTTLLAALGPLILPIGLQTQVPTTLGCFLTAPQYNARLDGERLLSLNLVTILENLGLLDSTDPALGSETLDKIQQLRELTTWPLFVEGLVEVHNPQPTNFQARLALMVQLLEIPSFPTILELFRDDLLQEHIRDRFAQTELGMVLEKCEGLAGPDREKCLRKVAGLTLDLAEKTFLDILKPLDWQLVWLGVEG